MPWQFCPHITRLEGLVGNPRGIRKAAGREQGIPAIILMKLNLGVYIKGKLNQALEWIGKKYTRRWIKLITFSEG